MNNFLSFVYMYISIVGFYLFIIVYNVIFLIIYVKLNIYVFCGGMFGRFLF